MIYIRPISHRNLQSTLRRIALSSSGENEDKNATRSAVASLRKLSGVAIESDPWTLETIFSPSLESVAILSKVDKKVYNRGLYLTELVQELHIIVEAPVKYKTVSIPQKTQEPHSWD